MRQLHAHYLANPLVIVDRGPNCQLSPGALSWSAQF